MHTAMVIVAGFLALGSMILASRLVGWTTVRAVQAFIPLWLIATLGNMWVGVTQAGYTVLQEAPIAAVVFTVPALVAWLLGRRSA